ncbi:MAG: type II toxin-antitoxin system VapC family toxin [Terricaulis sp.]
MIIDASVALRWFLNEPGAADAADVFSQGAAPVAPDLVLVEIANGLWAAARRHRIDEATARAQLAATPHLFGELRSSEVLAPRAFEIARALDHPIYDCLYLAMAEIERMPLITVDARLQKAVTGTPWRNLVSVLTL